MPKHSVNRFQNRTCVPQLSAPLGSVLPSSLSFAAAYDHPLASAVPVVVRCGTGVCINTVCPKRHRGRHRSSCAPAPLSRADPLALQRWQLMTHAATAAGCAALALCG